MNMEDEIYPRPLTSRVQVHMEKIANAILEYKEVTGGLPTGSNANMVKALKSLNPRIFFRRELNAKDEVIDPWGRPYVYLVPGRENPKLFDLYSMGPTGKGKARPGDIIRCELFRI
jgi:hypothetical protein